jgi:hypothetical protein
MYSEDKRCRKKIQLLLIKTVACSEKSRIMRLSARRTTAL